MLFSSITFAQKETLSDDGIRFEIFNKVKFSDAFYFKNVLELRTVDAGDKTQAITIKPSLNYFISKSFSVGLGYKYFKFHAQGANHKGLDFSENRIWEYVTYHLKVKKLKTMHRIKVEHRFIDNIIVDGDKKDVSGIRYSDRIRYRMLLQHPLLQFKNEKPLLLRTTGEIYMNLEDGIVDNGFSQIRIVGLFGYKLMENSYLWLGYGWDYSRILNDRYYSNKYIKIKYSYDFDI